MKMTFDLRSDGNYDMTISANGYEVRQTVSIFALIIFAAAKAKLGE